MGGLTECAAGASLATAGSCTGVVIPFGIGIACHGLDNFVAGYNQFIFGQVHYPLTVKLLEKTGMSNATASNVNDALSIGGTTTAIASARIMNSGMKIGTSLSSQSSVSTGNQCHYFKNVKIEGDKQGKHIPGKHNYELGKSILDHNNPQSLLNNYAGTGAPRRGTPGQPGYRELVDFKEHIGLWKSKTSGHALPTTKGIIHYSKKGGHIVPEHPETKIW
ncbi:MAG: hypothetical protein H0T62_09570 [Parachlamydiaceae bacterium]|nr:hypothetical protein [Parachlamydiaceae bacterium]